MSAAAAERVPTFSSLAIRNYRLFWTGGLISNVGTWMARVAQDWPVLSVAMRSGDVADVRRAMGQRGLNWATVIDPEGDVARRYGLGAVPALVVIAPDGRISTTSVGYTTTWGMRARLWWAQWRA